jgi:hypothetical protein
MNDIVTVNAETIRATVTEIVRLETQLKAHLGNDNWDGFMLRLIRDVGIFGGITHTDHTAMTGQIDRLKHVLNAIREFDYPEIVARERQATAPTDTATPGEGVG